MTLLYTTVERIARRLRARLSLSDRTTNQPIGYPTTSLTMGVDNDLLDLVGEEKENFINYILDQVYETPLKHNHPIIADIVESLVIGDLLKTHFQGQMVPGSDYGTELKNDAYLKLNMLVTGFNIQIPGMPQVQSYPGMMPVRRIILKGEIVRIMSPEKINVNNQFILTNRPELKEADTFGFIQE